MIKKKIFAVIDTETANSLEFPLIYDLGVSICDKKGNIIEQANWIVREIYYNNRLMDSAYYGSKRPIYDEMIAKGEIPVVSFKKAIFELNKILERNQVDTICAYNLGFDMRAMKSTSRFLHLKWNSCGQNPLFWKNYQEQDIWGLACETLYKTFNFNYFIVKHNFFTPAFNPRTSAEIGYRFIHRTEDFVEKHQALADTEIEVEILSKCLAMKKGYTKGIFWHPWRVVANNYQNYLIA